MNTLSAYLHGFDYDWARLTKRSGSRIWLVFLLCCLPIIGSAAPLAEGLATGDPNKLLIAAFGIIGGFLTLLGAIVKLMSEQAKRMGRAIPRGVTDEDRGVKSQLVDFNNRLSLHEDLVREWRKNIDKHLRDQDGKLDTLGEGMAKLLKIAEAVKEA